MLKRLDLTKSDYIFLIILFIATFIRFYRLPEMAHFEYDQEFASIFAYSVLKENPIHLIGQSLSIEGLFMGPIYFYYLTPFFIITNLHPLGGAIGTVVFGIFSIVVFYLVAKIMFGPVAGLIAAFFRSFLLFFINDIDWETAPAYASGVMVILTWFLFYRLWHGQTKFLPYLFFVFGLFTSIHPILFPFYLAFIILSLIRFRYLARQKKLPSLRTTVLSLFLFILPVSPLLIFELRHNFLQTTKFLGYFFSSNSPQFFSLTDKLSPYFQNNLIAPFQTLQLSFIPNSWLFFLSIPLVAILHFKKVGFFKDRFHLIALFVTFLSFIFYYTLFPYKAPEYYFLALGTLFIFYLAGILSLMTKNRVLSVLLILILVNIAWVNFKALYLRWDNLYLTTLYHKDQIAKKIIEQAPKNKDYFISYITPTGWNVGFNYLMKYYGHSPQTKKIEEPIFTIVIPWDLSKDSINFKSGSIGLILPK